MANGIYVPDQVDREAVRASEGSLIEAAADVAWRSQLSSRTATTCEFACEVNDARRKDAYFRSLRTIRPAEEEALLPWIETLQLWRDSVEFQRRWLAGGEQQGAENDVFFDEGTQLWCKRNNLSYHGTWLEFFQRLQLHNYLFPEAPLTLEGFVKHQGQVLPTMSQRTIRATRGATEGEVRKYMEARGFVKIADPARRYDFLHEATGIRADDLHDENVLVIENGDLVAIDPSPSMSWESKMARLQSIYSV